MYRSTQPPIPLRTVALLAVSICSISNTGLAAEPLPGEQIYRAKCASCHGDKGQGTDDEYPEPLAGDLAVPQLAALIAKTMPKDKAGECVGDDAQSVAAYIHEAFYSPDAQIRNRPPRIELSHLTVRQYRHSIADLIGSFREPVKWGSERGLKAEYFKKAQLRNNERAIERIDPIVDFNYGERSPDEKIEPKEFSMRWQGSLLAPETGEYEFIVLTDNGARLWVNDTNKALIDGWVKSGDDPEHRQTIWLLGGRVYPIKLEFFKSREKKASISLLWKLPRREVEVIPERLLSPQRVPSTLVVQTPFPPDDRSVGYERGAAVSKGWDQATTDAALEVVGQVLSQLNELARTRDGDNEREKRLREFCQRFAERAFRRPLTEEEAQLYIERQFQAPSNLDVALKRVLLLVLKSPRFLYPAASDSLRDYQNAATLALGLWDSLPDQALLDAAKRGELQTREQLLAQAERMSRDLRAQAKLRDFLLQWLRVDHVTDLAKDPAKFGDFDGRVAADLRTSLDLSIDELVSSDAADFRQLLQADTLYLNGRLAKFYGVPMPDQAPFQKVALEPEQRSGLLTHPFMLAGFAYTATSSPIHRGVFISRSVLGRALRPPPEAVTPLAPDLHADLTTRERVELQTKGETCMGCHALINPLGFTLENFDAVGRYRSQEQGKPIDAAGLYAARSGDTVKFNGVRELATYLVQSEETHNAITQQLFQYLMKQPPQAYGPQTLPELRQSLAKNDFNLRQLMVQIVVQAAQH